jgi:hypothetical protein
VLWATLANAQQPPTITLINGDIDGDNEVTLFDYGILVATFGLSEQDPGFNPEADLDGDTEVTLFDFGILVNHFGEIGVDALTGVEQPMEEGLTAPLRLQLSDWGGHPSRVISVEFRAKAVGTESNPDAPVYVKTVSIVAPSAEVDVELTLPAGAYTVQAKASHWLRGEDVVLTSVPWIFAAPTGANKVTVYWDEVPGATGYRVRWGTASGLYPNVSSVQPADARMLSITGLTSEQEYYFVVEAERNGVWSAPSEEDSAVPHVGAIPWDTRDAASILQAVRAVIGNVPRGQLDVLAPDGRYYTEDSFGNPVVTAPPGIYHSETSSINYQGLEVPLTRTRTEALENTKTGPYRRVRTDSGAQCVGARASFYLPPVIDPNFGNVYIYINSTYKVGGEPTEDTPCIYFGIAFPGTDMEGGLMFHAAGRQGISYPRWQPYLVPSLTRTPNGQPVLGGDPRNPRNHILYDSSNGSFGYYLDMQLNPVDFPFGLFWVKLTTLSVRAYDLFAEDAAFSHTYVGFAPSVPATGQGVRVRRVHSIAQRRQAVGSRGYARSDSFIIGVGVDYDPLIFGVDLGQPAEVYRYRNGSFSWQRWTEDLSDQPGSAGVFPSLRQNPIFVLDERVGEGGRYTRYYREIISIDLAR